MGLWSKIKKAVKKAGDAVGDAVEAIGDGINDGLNWIGDKIGGKAFFSWLGGIFKGIFSLVVIQLFVNIIQRVKVLLIIYLMRLV